MQINILNKFINYLIDLKLSSTIELMGAGRYTDKKTKRPTTVGTFGFSCSDLFIILDDNYITV